MTSLFAHLPLPDQRRFDPHAQLPAIGGEDAEGSDVVHTPPEGTAQADDLLDGLNPQQRQAVAHTGGQLLIIAGAGSGKTRVLAHRIAHLLATGRARPGEILAITFTNKAAAEMRERVAELVGPRAKSMWVSTFHSACVRILRREAKTIGLRSSFSIYDAADAQRLMTLVCRELDLDPKRFPPKAFYHRVSDLKNDLVDPDDFARTAAENPYEQNLAAAYRRYQERLREAHALDFDDLIMSTVTMLQAFPAIAEHYRRRFRHVLVDEYQDTNHAQYVLVRELVGGPGTGSGGGDLPAAELTVVGDADQSIYAFRGATIRNIVEFEKDYPAATTILLEQNYRSTQTILSAANAVIERNPGRAKKNLWTAAGAGDKIVGYVADTEHDEAAFVAEEIDALIDAGEARAGDVAIFYRTNAQSRALEEVLVRRGLPYRVIGGTRFYERREVKDAIAYLRAVANPDDSVNLRRILNVPKRGLGERSEAMVAGHAERLRISFGAALDQLDDVLGLGTRAVTGLRAFNDMLAGFRTLAAGGASPAEVLDAILDETGYLAQLRESSDPQDATRVENLAELHAVAAEFSAADPDADLGDFLERVALVADADQLPGEEEGGMVTLMTVHTAKGLEFPIVFATGLEDGTFPHSRSLADPDELAEERRLAYVALTRARTRLYLSRAGLRTMWGAPNELPASRFIADIPADLLDWRRTESAMSTLRQLGAYDRGASSGTGYGDYGRRIAKNDPAPTPSFGSAKPRGPVPNLEIGDRVTHDSYGLGRVVQVEKPGTPNAVAHVDFGDSNIKRLLLRFSPVTKL
ncbi:MULTISPECIES: DNA helicase PcrA [unclassified Pseudactinotalea]|uniref:DNA helicase PcrA n=1 Tax=unclassified Pseudactinotalea TaxID=2649176 RepID=UPI00128B5AFE|nr:MULTISPECIES: DNA helicase PcrA [unclassified Pseudactinotalea]MPV50800.1 DNA helicase PcrA [Pseudactinotalea sp. HY160]QGH70352.1 DNA helicase PcrA [Pseudactinotalea sp. HY158]